MALHARGYQLVVRNGVCAKSIYIVSARLLGGGLIECECRAGNCGRG
jgi:hypothetical protein